MSYNAKTLAHINNQFKTNKALPSPTPQVTQNLAETITVGTGPAACPFPPASNATERKHRHPYACIQHFTPRTTFMSTKSQQLLRLCFHLPALVITAAPRPYSRHPQQGSSLGQDIAMLGSSASNWIRVCDQYESYSQQRPAGSHAPQWSLNCSHNELWKTPFDHASAPAAGTAPCCSELLTS